ncbi:MAG: lasso peptide biosynthesis B2 protein [Chloroflexi bacterium]|nr:lasso peptide biosynthesis B2 protein [Chloroflexota bacterium]
MLVRRIVRLGPVLLARAVLELIVVDRSIHLGVPRSFTNTGSGSDEISARDVVQAQRYAYWIGVASRHHIIRAQCLHRSVLLSRWLARDRINHTLRIGVQVNEGILTAHAWIEVGSTIVTDVTGATMAFTVLTPPSTWRSNGHPTLASSVSDTYR